MQVNARRLPSAVLSDAVSGSSLVSVPGVSYFMIATHAANVARLIRKHVAKVATAGANIASALGLGRVKTLAG